MNTEEFHAAAKQMVDYVADYLENIRERPVLPSVEPGYLHQLIPDHAPEDSEKWEDVYKDIERVIMPGVSHWNHPDFHAYFTLGCSYPALIADMLSAAIGCVGFSWIASPACTELEVAMMDWLGKMLELPEEFLSGGKGGGVIQGTASEATFVALLAARSRIISQKKEEDPILEEADILKKLIVYTSDEAHCSVERACLLAGVKCHLVASDENESLRGDALSAAVTEDKEKGLIPFYVVATLGTTSTCAFDNLREVGPVCQKEGVWLHIDAAYAGSSFICPEYRPWLDGIEFSDSFNFNPHKWLLVNYDCSAMWLKDSSHLVDSFKVDPLYLRHDHQGEAPDFRMVQLAHDFEDLVKTDPRFEVTHKVNLGLVCFALKDQSNEVNQNLMKALNQDGRIYLVPSISKGRYFLRFAIVALRTNLEDIQKAWKVIQETADKILNGHK